jgi:hypothetical protein
MHALHNKPGHAIGILVASLAVLGRVAPAAQDRYTLKIPDGLAWSEFTNVAGLRSIGG